MQKKQLVRFSIQLLIVIVLLEFFLRIIFYQQQGRESMAIIETVRNLKRKFTAIGAEKVYGDFLLARPDSGREINKQIAAEAFASNHFEYSPWTEYKNIDFAGKYFNIRGLVRATVPDEYVNRDTSVVKTIFFFGGSTMYGVNVTDRETIAAAFVNEYKEQFPRGVSIKVFNYGISAHYSYNELMLLSHLVYSGHQPDIVIMFDGLNNFLISNASFKRLPYYYYRLRQASSDKINLKQLERVNDSTQTLFDYPEGYSEDALADTLVKNYLSDISQVKKMADAHHFEAFFFVQPTPFFNYPRQQSDPVCSKESFPVVKKAYGQVERKTDSAGGHFFLGNMLAAEKGIPFIDRFHYSPSMCRRIAKEIVASVGGSINRD